MRNVLPVVTNDATDIASGATIAIDGSFATTARRRRTWRGFSNGESGVAVQLALFHVDAGLAKLIDALDRLRSSFVFPGRRGSVAAVGCPPFSS